LKQNPTAFAPKPPFKQSNLVRTWRHCNKLIHVGANAPATWLADLQGVLNLRSCCSTVRPKIYKQW